MPILPALLVRVGSRWYSARVVPLHRRALKNESGQQTHGRNKREKYEPPGERSMGGTSTSRKLLAPALTYRSCIASVRISVISPISSARVCLHSITFVALKDRKITSNKTYPQSLIPIHRAIEMPRSINSVKWERMCTIKCSRRIQCPLCQFRVLREDMFDLSYKVVCNRVAVHSVVVD